MFFPASPIPLKHDIVLLFSYSGVSCSKRINILCIHKEAEGSLFHCQGGLMSFSFPALVYKQKILEYIKAMFIFPKLTKAQKYYELL